MRLNYLFIIAFVSLSITLSKAQSLNEFKPGVQKFGLNQLKKGKKQIYIASFNVNFEVYKEAIDYKASGGFRNNVKGEATARAAIGLNGLMQDDIQDQVNKLYTEFVSDYKTKGFEIISAETVGKTKTYEGWKKSEGPFIVESGLPGVLTCVPKDYAFYYKGETKKGKKKKGFLGGTFIAPKLSKELNNAVVVDVNLYVMYSENGNSWFKGGGAQVKLFVNHRLIKEYAVTAPKKNKIIGFKGAQSVEYINSNITFCKGKSGLGARTQYTGRLKKDLEINNVLKKEKVVVYSKRSSATATSINPVVIAGPSYSKQTKWIDADSKKYAEGLYNSISKFLKHHTSAFLANY